MATVQIDIPDRQAAILKAFVHARGLTVEQWLMQVVEQTASVAQPSPTPEQNSEQNAKGFIWDTINERMNALPRDVFENLPEDGSSQHDHYIYGLPKRDQ